MHPYFRSFPAVLLVLAHSLIFLPVRAADPTAERNWPAWRGPLHTGVAPEANPPTVWSETNHVKWKVKIPGHGLATPIIWENQIFIQTAIPTGRKVQSQNGTPGSSAAAAPAPNQPTEENRPLTPAPATASALNPNASPLGGERGTVVAEERERRASAEAPPNPSAPPGRRRGGGRSNSEKPNEYYQFVLLCLDRQTGKTVWQKIAREEAPHEAFRVGDASFASTSPVTDGQSVFAYFGSRGLYCYSLQGNLKWEKDFGKMQVKLEYGEGSSPALFGDTIVINWDHEGSSFIVALDKKSGQELWRQSREEKTSWSTPLIVQHEGKAQVITDATGKIRSYDLATGKLVWECAGLTANVIPSPVAAEGTVYCMSGFRGNALLAIRLGRTGDLTGTDAIAWSHHKSTPYVPSPLLYDGKLYFLAGNNGMLSCFDVKSGRPLIDAERLEAIPNVYSPPVGAGGRVYLTGRNGVTVVMQASGKLELLATNRLDENFDASAAVAGRELFLRGQNYLYCLTE